MRAMTAMDRGEQTCSDMDPPPGALPISPPSYTSSVCLALSIYLSFASLNAWLMSAERQMTINGAFHCHLNVCARVCVLADVCTCVCVCAHVRDLNGMHAY